MAPASDALQEEEAAKSILVAEDSITARTLVKNILEFAGYRVKTAADGADAWNTLAQEGFDLVVSDVEMPRMSGFDLTAKIRANQRTERLPVVLVTALDSREDRERGAEVGANAYVVKSGFDQGNLLEVVRRLI
jgi:two-component system, chemotaxis family, sensor kinase CheA